MRTQSVGRNSPLLTVRETMEFLRIRRTALWKLRKRRENKDRPYRRSDLLQTRFPLELYCQE